jgi:hypothetical protein
MKYLGNFKHCIDDNWLQEILTNRGMGRPAEGKKPNSIEEEIEYQRARDAGYTDNTVYFYMFDKNNVSFTLNLPFIESDYHWWITKMMPGNFMPMHVDPHTLYESNSQRYWIPLQDWEPGHVFMYENKVITDYKAGDLWTYENSTALHGAANIGFTPRVVLQISTYRN